jgi:hypothetical protein
MAEEYKADQLMFFVIDGEVVYVLRTDERMKAVLTSEPLVLTWDESMGDSPQVGDTWDGTKLTKYTG